MSELVFGRSFAQLTLDEMIVMEWVWLVFIPMGVIGLFIAVGLGFKAYSDWKYWRN